MKRTLLFSAFAALLIPLPAFALTSTVDGITWTYTVSNGEASVGDWLSNATAVPTDTRGWISIPSSFGGPPVTSIGIIAFNGCSRLQGVDIPDGVKNIGQSAFSGCSGLEEIDIPNSVTNIGVGAFSGCTAMWRIALGNGVASIGDTAFSNCIGLGTISVPDGVRSIGVLAFNGCRLLQSVAIGTGVANIGSGAFQFCSGLTEVHVSDLAAWCGVSFGSANANPCFYAHHLFLNDEEITHLYVPDAVTRIGDYAFYGCSGLTAVDIPDGVAGIGRNAFEGCADQAFDTSSFPGVKLVDGWAVGYTDSLSGNLDLAGVRGIADYAFYGCSGLRSIRIPDNVSEIGCGTFRDCSGLGSVSIPESVTNIGSHAFSGCSGLVTIAVPDSVAGIGESAFDGCGNLQTLVLPFAFQGNTDNLSIPSGCTVLFRSPFTWTANDDGETCTITGRLRQDAEAVIPEEIEGLAVTRIGDAAFSGDAALVSVVVPDGVEYIGEDAFRDCTSLESVSILDPDARVRDRAFYGCTALKRLTIPGEYNRDGDEWDEEHGEPRYVESSVVFGDGQETIEEVFVTPGSQRICGESFRDFTSCTNVVIPESVTSIGRGAFMCCSGLTSVTIPDSVTSIGQGAFDYCSDTLFDTESIPGVKLVDGWAVERHYPSGALDLSGIRGIAACAFWGCSSLTSVTIPDGVTIIGSYTFCECTGLTSITIPDSVTSIGYCAFCNCSGLSSIVVPNGVTNIGAWAFSNCSVLMSVQIPNSVTNIGYGAFYDIGYDLPGWCYDYGISPLIVLPARFEGHTSDMEIPEYCTVVFRGEGPLSIRETSLPTGWGDCVYFAFFTPDGGYGNVSWTATGLPQGLSLSSDGILSGTPAECGVYSVSVTATDERGDTATRTFDFVVATPGIDWRYRIVDGCAVLGGGTRDSPAVPTDRTGIVVIPDTLGGCPVTSIGDYAFLDCSELTSVVIPRSVTSIGDYAFLDCSELTSVVIPNSVTSIGIEAFGYCSGLTSITIPASVTSIGGWAFIYCSGLTAITVPASVTNIGEGVFANCPGLTSIEVYEANPVYDSRNGCNAIIGPQGSFENVLIAGCKNTVIPDGVTSIGYRAFSDCAGLTSIAIPDSVTRIEHEAFGNCGGLASIAIPDSVTFVGGGAFGGCSGLTSITIPCSVTNLGKSTFMRCSSLESVEITNPELVFTSSWGYYPAFKDCPSLKRVMIPGEYGKIEGYGSTVFGGTEKTVKEVLVTPGSTRIGESAFKGFTACTRVAIPDSVAEIGANAFSGCSSLASVTVPPGVASIGDNAFSGCGSLRTVFCPDTLSGAVSGIGVPSGCNVVFYDASIRWTGLGFDWAFATDASAGDGYSMRSQALGAGGTAKLEATVEGIGTLSFDWRVSTFARRHYARFYVDGAQQKYITGETEWTTETIRLGEGTHRLEWTYEKSAAATSGDDAAFLDNVHWSPLTLDEALDATNLVWTADSASPWIPQIAETADGVDAAKSGAVSGEATSGLATTVNGPGELSWKWKARIDGIAGVDVWLDGEMLLDPYPYLNETADWTDATLDIEGDGPHRVEFRFWNGGAALADCAYVDQVSWTPAKPTSIVVEGVEIPVAWLETNAPAALAAAGGDYEAAAHATAANGADKVWQCYVSGVSPTNAAARFEARIGFENGDPVVTWTPDLNEGGTKSERVYTVEGKTNLVDRSWGPTNESTRFFRVKVSMP